jgi:anti-sigma factor RsiW
MNCENIRELLNAYIDGILSDKDRAVVESHLQTCNDCRNELDELKAAIKLVRGMDRIVPPPWFAEQVMSKVREDAVKEKGIIQSLFYPLHIKVPIQAFATVVVAILAVVIYKYSVPEVKQPVFQPAL